MSIEKSIEQLQFENENLLLKEKQLKAEIGELKNILDAIDEYRTLKEFEGDLRLKAEELRRNVKESVKSLKTEIFG
jgi:hypothetical protein